MIDTPHTLMGAIGWCIVAVVLGGVAIWVAVRVVERLSRRG